MMSPGWLFFCGLLLLPQSAPRVNPGVSWCSRLQVLDIEVQEFLAHKKQRPPRTLQWEFAWDPMAALRRGGVSYEPGTPVTQLCGPLTRRGVAPMRERRLPS